MKRKWNNKLWKISRDSSLICQTILKTQANTQTNRQRDKRTDARNRIRCILALKGDIWWQYFNDFPDNQQTKFRVFIGWFWIFIPHPPIKFLSSIALRPPILMDAPDRHNGQIDRHTEKTDVSLCKFAKQCALQSAWLLTCWLKSVIDLLIGVQRHFQHNYAVSCLW